MTGRQQHTAFAVAALVVGVLVAGAPRVATAADAPPAPATTAADIEFFESRVRPVLVEHCYRCHSADAKSLKGGLRLDSRDGVLRGGESGPAIQPGDPAKSRLLNAIRYEDPDLQMPPKTRLSDREIADLTAWVAQGAAWPDQGAPPKRAAELTGSGGSVAAFDLWKRRAEHWAWQPVQPHDPPAVRDANWPRTPVDRFLLAKLEANNLTPAPPADRDALLRRTYFAITGLPPSPEDLEAFLADAAPDALEKVVDRLLASPHFGERWGRHWLDVVRYSDTLGNETDLPIHNAWRYRDYVIRAFNADLPYDQFVLEHLAGDLLPEPRRHPAEGFNESLIGTAFYWLGEGRRSPVDLRLAQADSFDNQIDVTCKAFMAMTVSCARCHDHKFDAIPTSDYYALYGYLKSSRYTQAQINRADLDARAAEMLSLRSKIRETAGAALRKRAAPLSGYLTAAADALATGQPAAEVAASAGLDPAMLDRWVAALKEPADVAHPMFAWQRLAKLGPGAARESVHAKWQALLGEAKACADGLAAAAGAAGAQREGDADLADFNAAGYVGWVAEDQAFGPAPLKPGDFLLGADPARPVATFVRDGAWAHSSVLSPKLEGTLRSRSFTIDQRYLHVLAAGQAARMNVIVDHFVMIQDPLYGTLRRVLNGGGHQWQTFDLAMWQGHRAYIEFCDTTTPDLHMVGEPVGVGPDGYAAVSRVVLSRHQEPPPAPARPSPMRLLGEDSVDSLAALAQRYQRAVNESLDAFQAGRLDSLPDGEARAMLLAWIVEHGLLDATLPASGSDDDWQALDSLFQQFRAVESQLPAPQRVPAMADGTPDEEHVFIRGSPKTPGPSPEPRRMLQAVAGPLAQQPPASPMGSGRLELARRVADPANPLTARVMVNRVWHHVFGRGLVPSVDNFGALGETPSHPELLNYLADRFVKEGWSVKKLVRELVLSSAFRMSSTAASPEADVADPDNRLLHRMPVRRLEAEAIRDQILAVSGRLDVGRVGGPPVEIFLTPYMDTYADSYGRPKTSGPLDGDGRRSLYIMVRRNFLTPMLVAFDSPPPLNTQGRRGTSNVPAQALIMMNDPFVAEQAKLWATRVLARNDLDTPARIRHMYLQAYSRPPTDEELAIAQRFMERQGAELGIAETDRATDPRVWADLAHVLMNVKEFIFLN